MTALIDIDALTENPAAPAAEPDGAVSIEAKPDLKRARSLNLQDTDAADRLRKLVPMLREAHKLLSDQQVPKAARKTLEALDVDPDSAIANHMMGLCLDKLGHISRALDFYERAWRLDPMDAALHHNLGMAAWKLDMLDAAERFYRIALEINPGDVDVTINLAGVMRDNGRFADAIEILRATIYANQENASLWNSLGTVLLEQGAADQALTFYDEALRLNPKFGRAWHNTAYARVNLGKPDWAMEAYDNALEFAACRSDSVNMHYGRALTLLALGRLEEAWKEYDIRLDADYGGATLFISPKPMWFGDGDVAGKRVLLIGEQGLGDEVLFASCFQEFIDELGPDGHLTIACEHRLRPLFERSFPAARIIEHRTVSHESRDVRGVPEITDWDEFDLWAPIASIVKRYRSSVEEFPYRESFLTADESRLAEMRAALAALPAGPKIGLCWKSKLMNVKRSKYFSAFEQWKPILQTPGAVFVSMQYGDTSEEIAFARDELGVEIHTIPDLDLMKDLEGVAAAGAALDLVIGPANASTNLAASVGGVIWQIGQKTHWPFHNTDRLPWYPTARAFIAERIGEWDGALAKTANALKEFVAARTNAR